MKDILTAPFVEEMKKTTANMYRLGWDERNGGNISYLLDGDELARYLDPGRVIRRIETGVRAKELAGRALLVTGSGKYFRNVTDDPETNLGVIRIADDGTTAELLWGFCGGGRPTSELPAHLKSHIARLAADPENRVIMHTHPTHTLAMNYVHELDEKSSRTRCGRCAPSVSWSFPRAWASFPGCSAGQTRSARPRRKKWKSSGS